MVVKSKSGMLTGCRWGHKERAAWAICQFHFDLFIWSCEASVCIGFGFFTVVLCSISLQFCWMLVYPCGVFKAYFWFLLFYEGLPLLGCMQEKVLGCFSVVLCIILIGLKTYMQEKLMCALLGWNWWWYLQGSKSNIPCVGVLCWRWFGSIHPAVWQGFWSNCPALYAPVR